MTALCIDGSQGEGGGEMVLHITSVTHLTGWQWPARTALRRIREVYRNGALIWQRANLPGEPG